MAGQKIYTYDSSDAFTQKFMPGITATRMIKPDADWFFIVRVEEMYKLVTRQVPASRSIHHTCIYLTSGTATMKIGSDQYRISKGELLFVPAGQVFSFGPGDVNRGYLLGFHPDMLTRSADKKAALHRFTFLQVWGYPKIQAAPDTSRAILHICKRLLTEYRSYGQSRPAILQPYLMALLGEVDTASPVTKPTNAAAGTRIANQFRELITRHITTEQLVSDYAQRLHITPNHLNKVVKAATGKSPTRWIDEAIVSEAKILLYQSDASIGEIAATVGISDAAYFSRLFKKYEGITPLTYRQRIEKS